MTLPMMIACSSDDEGEENSRSNVDTNAYTAQEIVDLLTGKWIIYGKFEGYYIIKNLDMREEFEYTGTIEFKADKKVKIQSDKIPVKIVRNGQVEEIYHSLNNMFDSYSIYKKEGRNYISFNEKNPNSISLFSYDYQIESLDKNTFKLILDQDILYEDNVIGHVHMTMISG